MSRDLRRDAITMIDAALAAVEPGRLVGEALRFRDGNLSVAGHTYNLSEIGDIYVLGAGKAAAPMAAAVEDALEERISAGTIVVKDGYNRGGVREIEVLEASHPVPDERGCEAARKLLGLAAEAGPDDLVICLISGGGSALLSLPAGDLSLSDVQQTTEALLGSGAAIGEVNTVRKHLTAASAGRLAAAAYPAAVLTLVISDVIGDDLGVIASGPTVPDSSTFADAIEVLADYGLTGRAPAAVLNHLKAGVEGRVAETPKQGDPAFGRVAHAILANNAVAVAAAAAAATTAGFNTVKLEPLQGEARDKAGEFAELVRKEARRREPEALPACMLAGGETTVTVRGGGTGGRAQEFALAATAGIAGLDGVLVFACGTDGTDGPTDAAGAFADGSTLERAAELGLDPAAHLVENNSYPFFRQLGDLIMTGPTGTNVNDIYGLLVAGDLEE